ncbi:MAG TPA: hypothetical protein VGE11_12630 [Pseudonocardia sp.]
MLLLVLILVLVAFGLLVVALLTGSVLCAWLSVAVSVAAAVVLVVDWLQRRSALKAGATAAAAPASPSAEAMLLGEPDPVTEVLPVVRPHGDSAAAEATADESRFDRPMDGQQTIIMPAVQPSGSGVRPSGAEGPTTSSGGSSSPSVTNKPREAVPAEASRSATDSRAGDPEATVSVDIRKRTDSRTVGAAAGDAAGEAGQAAAARAGTSGTSVFGAEKAAAAASDTDRAGSGSAAERPKVGSAPGDVAATAAMSPAGSATGPATASATGTPAGPAGTLPKRAREGAVDGPAYERPDPDGPTSVAATESRSDPADDQPAPTVSTMRGVERPDSRAAETRSSNGRTHADRVSADDAATADPESTISTSSAVAATTTPASASAPAADSPVAGAGPAAANSPTAANSPAAESSTAGGDQAAVDSAAADKQAAADTQVSFDKQGVADKQAADSAAGRGAAADQATRSTFGGPIASGHELFDPVSRSATAAADPPPPSGGVEETAVMSSAAGTRHVDENDPPEEPFDPDVARIVARMDDEVFVIDEQPRYHVASCRAVTTQASIPLPAREAIELGFTPCGWCTPDAVLGERGRASARP